MNAVIIGSGNVATHLAKALEKAGVQIVQIWSRNFDNAAKLATEVSADPITDLNQVSQADFCFIAVKDDVVASVIMDLKHFEGTIAHTAGAIAIDVFDHNFSNYGVFYPLQTFSKTRKISFENIPICVEGINKETQQRLHHLAAQLSHQVFEIDSAERKVLHVAAVFACNFPNYLYNLAAQLLAKHDLNFEIIRPLILETAEKVQHHLPSQVQTGPAIRGDEETMHQHLSLLKNQPELAEIYTLLSKRIKSSK